MLTPSQWSRNILNLIHDHQLKLIDLLLSNPTFQKAFFQEEIDQLELMIMDEIEDAYTFAVESEYPDASEVLTDVYAVDNDKGVAR